MLKVSCTFLASSTLALAEQAVAGLRTASSSAIVGPDRVASLWSGPRTSASISVARSMFVFSMPLLTLTTGTPAGMCGFNLSKTLRTNWQGTAETISWASFIARLSSAWKIRLSGSLWPGMNFTFSRLLSTTARYSASYPHMVTCRDFSQSIIAHTLPIAPSPIIVIRSNM